MKSSEIGEQIDSLVDQLKKATEESATGAKSWTELDKFLSNYETLAGLHDPESCNVVAIIKRMPICYYIASKEIGDGQQLADKACELLPRIEKLILGELFPRSANYHLFLDSLEQVLFLSKIITDDRIDVGQLNRALTMSDQLIGFCIGCFKREKIFETELARLNSYDFERIFAIIRQGSSRDLPLDTNTKAVKLMRRVVLLFREFQSLTSIDEEKFERIYESIWSIVHNNLRRHIIDYFAYTYRISKSRLEEHRALKEETTSIVGLLPANDDALLVYCKNPISNIPEVTAADVVMLNSMLQARDYKFEGYTYWPGLDFYLSKSDPMIREACLDIAKGLFGNGIADADEFDSMFKHLNLIIDDVTRDQSDEHQGTRLKVFTLLTSIKGDLYPEAKIETCLIEFLKTMPIQCLDANMINLIDEAIKSNHRLDSNSFRPIAKEKFETIYKTGVETKSRADLLRRLFTLATIGNNYQVNYEHAFYDILFEGCNGVVPKGCNRTMLTILMIARSFIEKGSSNDDLLPIANKVYDREDSSTLSDKVVSTLIANQKAFEIDKELIEVFKKLTIRQSDTQP